MCLDQQQWVLPAGRYQNEITENLPSPSRIPLDLIITYGISNMLRYSLYIAITRQKIQSGK